MAKTAIPDSRQHMLHVNVRQKDFYESRFEANQAGRIAHERAANTTTNFWSKMRIKMMSMRKLSGADSQILELHRTWMSDIANARVLDLGCFSGNHLSLWIAEHCADYTGIDLSAQATALLDAKLKEQGLSHARAYAMDFLANDYPDNHFDLVYAYSVLHHFKDMPIMLRELRRVLKPGGMVISLDPLMTEPLNRFARMLYRPLQTDRDWEWPFNRATFRTLQQYFELADIQGYVGMSKLGFPLQLVPGLGGLGRAVGRWGTQYDMKHAHRPGMTLYICWGATLRMCKPQQP